MSGVAIPYNTLSREKYSGGLITVFLAPDALMGCQLKTIIDKKEFQMEKNEIQITTDFLCDLWMAVFKEANTDYTEDEYSNALVELMADLEKILVLKLQNEMPNIAKILAIITEFGQSEPIKSIAPLLKAYTPILNEKSHQSLKAA